MWTILYYLLKPNEIPKLETRLIPCINDITLESLEEAKYIGVILYLNLSWNCNAKTHVQKVLYVFYM